MLRVLLVLEDYNELIRTETILKKVGFDVDGVQNQRLVAAKILSLNPQVIVATAKGKNVNGLKLAKELAHKGSKAQFVLIKGSSVTLDQGDVQGKNLAEILAAPIRVTSLLKTLARLGTMDVEGLLAKFSRLFPEETDEQEPSPEALADIGSPPAQRPGIHQLDLDLKPSSISSKERSERYSAVLDQAAKAEETFDRKKVVKNKVKTRAEEGDTNNDLEDERKKFVINLVKASKKSES